MNAESERNYAQLAILNWIKGGILSDWSFAEVYNDMGNAYELLGFISDSLNCYTKAIDLKSDYYQAYSNLALLLHKYFYTPENYKRAELLYKKCLEIKPDYQYALSNYALLLEESDWKAALQKDVEFLCAPFGQYTDFITNMALILEEEKISPELAGMFYANLCKVKPHSLATKFNLANFKRRRGDSFDEVYKLLNDVLKGMPNSDIVNFTLALLYARDKNWKRVIEICEADKERHRYYIPDDILIGWSRIQINDEKKAIINDLISSIEKYNSIDNKKNKDYAILLGLLHYEIYSLLVDGKGKEANRFLSDARDISKGYIEFPKIDCSFDIQHAYDFVISVLDKEYLRISEDRIFKNRNIHLTEESESVLNDLDVILNKGYV